MENAPLFEALSDEPVAALRHLLATWYGLTVDLEAQTVPSGVPRALAPAYRLRSVAPKDWRQNRIVPADRLDWHGDKCVFYVENQDVVVWGVAEADLDSPDPCVWERENVDDAVWLEAAPTLSIFLVQLAIFETTFGCLHGASAIGLEAAAADAVMSHFHRLPMPRWHWVHYPMQFYAGERTLAVTMGPPTDGRGGGTDLFIAGMTDLDIEFLEPHLAEGDWPWYSPRDGEL